jgi:hypothetical protein
MTDELPRLSGRHQDAMRHAPAHPLSHNAEWRALAAPLRELGSREEHTKGSISAAQGRRLETVKPHDKNVDADDLVEVQRVLEMLGCPTERD